MKKYLDLKLILPFSLAILSFIVYWITKPPSPLWIDSGTMLGASASLGIPNPPGFPFYMMASHLFAILPIFNVLTRLELFTIVFSVAAIVLLYKIILLILENNFFFYKPASDALKLNASKSSFKYFAAFFGAASLAFSYQYWSQSQNTEAFIFTDFFLILFIYLLLFLEKKRKDFLYSSTHVDIPKFASYFFRAFALLAFLYGLAAGANPTIGVLVPGVLYVMYLNRRILNIQKVVTLGLIFAITVSLVYAYLPIRASAWPFVNWGNPQTLSLFIGHLRGEGLNIYEPSSGSINGFTGSPVVFVQSVSHFFYLLLVQFTPVLLPFLFFGMYLVIKRNKRLFWLLMSVVLVNVVYSGIYFSGNQESWFILSFIICSIFIGIGFYFALSRFKIKENYQKFLFLLWLVPLLFWFIPLNRSGHFYTTDYGINLYSTLKKNAILIGTGDFTNSLGFYFHDADKYREDVTPITANVFYVNRWERDSLKHSSDVKISPNIENIIQYKSFDEYNRAMNELINDNIDNHPIYVTHLTLRASVLAATNGGQLQLDDRFKFIPHGLSLEIVRASDAALPDMASFDYKFKAANFPEKKPFYLENNYKNGFRNILNDYAYGFEALGDWYFNKGRYEDALKYYKKADQWSPNNAEILGRFGQYYGVKKEFDISRQFFSAAVKLSPDSLGLRFNYAETLSAMGLLNEAINQYQIIQQTIPGQDLALQAEQKEQNLVKLGQTQGSQSPTPGTVLPQTGDLAPYSNDTQNYTFSYPKNWSLSKTLDGVVFLTNKKTDLSKINLYMYGKKISNGSAESLIKQTPIKGEGVLLDTQTTAIQGFKTTVQIWGNKGTTIQIYVLQKGSWTYIIRLDLTSANSISDFNKVIGSFRSLHD